MIELLFWLFCALILLSYASAKALERWVERAFAMDRRHRLLTKARESVLSDRCNAGRWLDAVNGMVNAVNRSEPPKETP